MLTRFSANPTLLWHSPVSGLVGEMLQMPDDHDLVRRQPPVYSISVSDEAPTVGGQSRSALWRGRTALQEPHPAKDWREILWNEVLQDMDTERFMSMFLNDEHERWLDLPSVFLAKFAQRLSDQQIGLVVQVSLERLHAALKRRSNDLDFLTSVKSLAILTDRLSQTDRKYVFDELFDSWEKAMGGDKQDLVEALVKWSLALSKNEIDQVFNLVVPIMTSDLANIEDVVTLWPRLSTSQIDEFLHSLLSTLENKHAVEALINLAGRWNDQQIAMIVDTSLDLMEQSGDYNAIRIVGAYASMLPRDRIEDIVLGLMKWSRHLLMKWTRPGHFADWYDKTYAIGALIQFRNSGLLSEQAISQYTDSLLLEFANNTDPHKGRSYLSIIGHSASILSEDKIGEFFDLLIQKEGVIAIGQLFSRLSKGQEQLLTKAVDLLLTELALEDPEDYCFYFYREAAAQALAMLPQDLLSADDLNRVRTALLEHVFGDNEDELSSRLEGLMALNSLLPKFSDNQVEDLAYLVLDEANLFEAFADNNGLNGILKIVVAEFATRFSNKSEKIKKLAKKILSSIPEKTREATIWLLDLLPLLPFLQDEPTVEEAKDIILRSDWVLSDSWLFDTGVMLARLYRRMLEIDPNSSRAERLLTEVYSKQFFGANCHTGFIAALLFYASDEEMRKSVWETAKAWDKTGLLAAEALKGSEALEYEICSKKL